MQSWKTLVQVPIVYHTCTKHPFDGQQYRAKKNCVKPLTHIGKLRLLHSIIATQTRSQQSLKYRIAPAVIYRCYPDLEKKIVSILQLHEICCFGETQSYLRSGIIFISLHMLFKIMAKSFKKLEIHIWLLNWTK